MKLSVITINRNNADGLKKTVESVLNQSWKEFEYIIIDGNSTDTSLDIIKNCRHHSGWTAFKWLSEPDTGVYQAMNKGIRMATGEYIHFLNSGDWLINNLAYEQLDAMTSWNTDVIYGNKIEVYKDGKEVLNKGLAKSNLGFDDVYRGCIPHTAAFTKRELFQRFGLFDESYKIVSDTLFFLKAIGFGQCSSEYVDCSVSYFDMQGMSKRADTLSIREREWKDAREKVMSPRLMETYEFYLKEGYKLEQIQKTAFTRFFFRVLNRLACILNKIK
ncbi:MAG: glycosyltransferase family 2 protein [Mangrovibacterium sp.]